MKKTLQKANKGGIEINFENLEQQTKSISNALQQLIFVILTIATVYFSNHYYENGNMEAFSYSKWAGILFFVLFLRYFLKRKQ